MAGTINTIGISPLPYRFFAVGPDEPDAVAIALLSGSPSTQLVGVFEQDSSGRTAIVGADEPGVAQWINRVVVAEDDDDAIFCAGKFRDNVADRELPFHRVSGEGVVFDLIAFEVVENVTFELLMILASHIARAEGCDLPRVLEGAFGVDVWKRGGVGCGGFWRSRRRGGRFGFWGCGGGASGGDSFGAGYRASQGEGQQQH